MEKFCKIGSISSIEYLLFGGLVLFWGRSKNISSETTFIGVNSAEIKEHNQNKNILEVTVEFVSEIISCVKDKDNKVISGDPETVKKVHDIWKFSKDIRSPNPNWYLIDTQV